MPDDRQRRLDLAHHRQRPTFSERPGINPTDYQRRFE
jgi:hypothetical protein